MTIRISEECEIVFPSGDIVKIDYTDLKIFANHRWFITPKGRTKYLQTNIINDYGKLTSISFHILIMNNNNGFDIDHINYNGLDNRKSNLRLITHQQNMNRCRKQVNTSSQYRGVYFCNTRKIWRASINNKSKTKSIGSFNTEKEAANAYNNYILINKLDKVINVL